jgi:hypothetical protein
VAADDEAPPLVLGAGADADPRAPGDVGICDAAVLDQEALAAEVGAIVGERYAHRPGKAARTAAQFVVRYPSGAPPIRTPSPPHQRDAVERRQRPQQHGRRLAIPFGDDVEEVVDAVVEIDVGKPRRTVERSIAGRAPSRCVARGVRFPDIPLDLHDCPCRYAADSAADEDLPDEVSGHGQRRPVVERAWERHGATGGRTDRK